MLFSGDALYDGPLLDQLDGSDTGDYERTIERLRDLPVTVVHGGHERSFGRDRLVALCDAYLAGEPFTPSEDRPPTSEWRADGTRTHDPLLAKQVL